PQFLAATVDPSAHYRFRPLRDQPLLRGSGLASFYFDWLEHEFDPAYWRPRQIEDFYGALDVPSLHIGGWYDAFLDGTIRNFAGLSRCPDAGGAGPSQRLIIGPWHHIPGLTSLSQTDFGPEAFPSLDHEQLRWFDWWLRDAGAPTHSAIRVFAMGANRW